MLIKVLLIAQLAFVGALQIGSFSVDECTEEGQMQIRDRILSLFQGADVETSTPIKHINGDPQEIIEWNYHKWGDNKNKPKGDGPYLTKGGYGPLLARPPVWPKDELEDPGTPLSMGFEKMTDDQRWKQVALMKAFNPTYFMETLGRENRDNMHCNMKRMECMSIDDMGLPSESKEGTRAWFAIYDSLSHDQQHKWMHANTEARKWILEPLLHVIYYSKIYPSKTFVEAAFVPSTYPGPPIPSMPSAVEGDWDVKADYSRTYGQYLPGSLKDETGDKMNPRYLSNLLQVTEAGRQQCNDRPTESKKIMCHLDFMGVMNRIGNEMSKKGMMPKLTTEQEDGLLNNLSEIDAKVQSLKKDWLRECVANKKEQ